MPALDALSLALAPAGLNLVGVASAAAYDASVPEARGSAGLLPGARSILVVASGGPSLWHAFVADLRRDPRGLTAEAHPLDAFVRRAVDAADPALGDARRRWFFAAADADVHLDFRVLGHLAGLGGRSRLGLLLHPRYGTWLGLRAAVFTDAVLPAAPPPAGDPCAGCPAPCAPACPGSAFPGGSWDVARCSAFHDESDRCASSCASRLACPAGAEHRYPEDEVLYHYDRPAGRRLLRARLGIGADGFPGEGPRWGNPGP